MLVNILEIDWYLLSRNPNAIELLTANQDKINWNWLSRNPNAIKLLTDNQGKINWDILSRNPNAIDLLSSNLNKVNLDYLISNPCIFDKLTWSPLTHKFFLNKKKIIDFYHNTLFCKDITLHILSLYVE